MKDQTSIFGVIITFLAFLISIFILYYYIQNTANTIYLRTLIVSSEIYEKYSELIRILNNQTLYSSPYLTIQNIGYRTLDLSCFQLFVNGNLVQFNYTQRFLLPNQIENITFPNNYLNNESWNYINLITCNGLRYDDTIYVS